MERKTFIKTLVFTSGLIFVAPQSILGNKLDNGEFRISMIYNNTGSHAKLKNAWGLSIWIETANSALLFDTGGDSTILNDNIANLKFDIQKLSKIIISHNHWDHINGLESILENNSNSPEIVVVEHDAKQLSKKYSKAEIIAINSPQQIDTNIWTTGELVDEHGRNQIFEQGLILQQADSAMLLTGCSHSGIVEMVEKTIQLFPDKTIEIVVGGFHLGAKSGNEIAEISARLKSLNVQKIAPSHCTGDKALAYFKSEWQDKFIDINLGNEYRF